MPITESELPGVGTKFEIDIGEEEQLIVIVHNSGKREVYVRRQAGADSEKLLELSDGLARKVGSILEGAYFQPVSTESAETLLAEESTLEWYTVEDDSGLAGRTLGEAEVGERTGVSILVVQRGETTIPSPDAETTIEPGDRLVVNGSQDDIERFSSLLASDTSE